MANIVACRGCLYADGALHEASGTFMQEIYENLTRFKLNMPQYPVHFCDECRYALRKCQDFYDKCIKADAILLKLFKSDEGITNESIKSKQPPSLKTTDNIEEIKQETTDSIDNDVDEKNFNLQEWDDHPVDDSSDDDVPLIKIVKVEKEVKEKRLKRGFKEQYAKEILLTKDEQFEEMNERKKSQNFTHSPFKCETCFKGFVDEMAYNNHLLKHDKKSGEHICGICKQRYPTRRQLIVHTLSSHRRRYECVNCKHRSQTAHQARDHEKWHLGHKYECKQCGVTFDKPTSHLTHMRKAHSSLYVCTACGVTCVSKHGLKMHRAKAQCRLAEPTSPSLQSHCNECKIQFLNEDALTRHVLTSVRHKILHRTAKKCSLCNEDFITNTELIEHLKKHRNTLKPNQSVEIRKIAEFECDLCPSMFANKSKLQVHYKRIHLGLKYLKDYVCEVCGKHFKSNATLKYHHRTHTGEKPYPCTECPKRFTDRNQLRIHMRMHTGDRPYSCSVCALSFRQKPALNRHMRVHTGAKPYACTYCNKAFSQSNSLKLHIKTVHLKIPSNRKKDKSNAKVVASF